MIKSKMAAKISFFVTFTNEEKVELQQRTASILYIHEIIPHLQVPSVSSLAASNKLRSNTGTNEADGRNKVCVSWSSCAYIIF